MIEDHEDAVFVLPFFDPSHIHRCVFPTAFVFSPETYVSNCFQIALSQAIFLIFLVIHFQDQDG
jgi:hypothetical protein